MTGAVSYIQSRSNKRDLMVKPGEIIVEDRHPENGGRPITTEEIALVRRVRQATGWGTFFISQAGGFAWTKEGERSFIYLGSLP